MWTREFYAAGLLAYAFGALGGLAAHLLGKKARRFSSVFCCLALGGALLHVWAAYGGLTRSPEFSWALPTGVPYIHFSVRVDPLSSFFLLTLSLLGSAVAVYSLGYLRHGPAGRIPALSASLLN